MAVEIIWTWLCSVLDQPGSKALGIGSNIILSISCFIAFHISITQLKDLKLIVKQFRSVKGFFPGNAQQWNIQ